MVPFILRIAILTLLVAPAFGAAGDGTRSLTNLVFGPIVYLVAAVGILACLYQFARGHKAAAFFILGGLFFLGFARAVLRGWLDPGGSAGFTMNLGAFPIFGDNGSVTETSSKNFYGYIASWAYIGLSISHALSIAMLSLGIPLLIATIGALITYHRITVRQQAGSVIGYVISAVLVVVFCVFPSASFVPPAESAAPSSDVMRAIAGLDSGVPLPSSTAPDALSIPLLPALILTAGTDLTQAIGNVINPDPNSMYVAQMLRAARSSAMPDGWETEYQDFAVHCAAAYKAFVISEVETSGSTVPFIKSRLAEARLGRVSASSLNLISNWGDSVLSFVPLHAYVANDSQDDQNYNLVSSDPDKITNSNQLKSLNRDVFWISPQIANAEKEDSIMSLNIYPGFNPGNHLSLPYIKYNNGNNMVVTAPKSLLAFGSENIFRPEQVNNLEIPYCSIPRDTRDPRKNIPPFPIDLDVDLETGDVSGYDNLGEMNPGVNGGLSMNFTSAYLHDIGNLVDQSRSLTILPFDWSDRIRVDLISSFSPAICRTACGNPSHKYYWSCMVSGIFVQLSGESACQSSSEVAQAFYGIIPINSKSSTGVSFANVITSGFYPPVKPRSSADTLRGGPGAGNPPSSWDMPTLRSVADLIMAAPGNFSQHPLARDVFTIQKDSNSLSFWGMISGIPKMGMWVLASVASMAVEIVSFLWPHFMGLTVLIFLIIYPIFGALALWPGKWHVLLDWARGALWVLLWAPMVSLGFSFINGGAFINSSAAFLSPHDGPGNALLQIVGICLIFSAPAIAQAVISPGLDGLARLGASVYGQGFRATGLSQQLGTLIGGMTGGLISATAAVAGGGGGGGAPSSTSGGLSGAVAGNFEATGGGIYGGRSQAQYGGYSSVDSARAAGDAGSGDNTTSKASQQRNMMARNMQVSQVISGAALEAGSQLAPVSSSAGGANVSARQGRSAGDAQSPAGGAAGGFDQARSARMQAVSSSAYGPSGDPEHRQDDARKFDVSVDAFQAAQAAGNVPAASAAAHAIIASHDSIMNGGLREGAAATLGDVKKLGDAMEYLGKHGEPSGAEGARRMYREGQRMADGMLRDGQLTNPSERKEVTGMRDRLRLGEAQARLSKADSLVTGAKGLEARAAKADTEGERNVYNKRASEMRQEALVERKQAGRQAGDALANMSESVNDSLAQIKESARSESGAAGPGLRRLAAVAGDLLSLSSAAGQLEKGICPPMFEMRKADGHGIADKIEAIAGNATPVSREMLLGLSAAAEGRNEESAEHLNEVKNSGALGRADGQFDSVMRSLHGSESSGQTVDPKIVSDMLVKSIPNTQPSTW